MATESDDLNQFLQRPASVAARIAGSELFAGRVRTFDLPASWAALITRTDGPSEVAAAGSIIDGASVEELLIVRITPVDVSLHERDIPTQDGFLADADGTLRLTLPPERSDLAAFGKHVMGSYRRATTDNLARHVQPAIHLALTELFADQPIATLMAPESAPKLVAALTEAVGGPCFVAGLNLTDPPTITVRCRAYTRVLQTQQRIAIEQREHEAAQPLEAALSEARRRHLDDLAALLNRAKELASSAPGADLGNLLKTFSQSQRGALYQALFATESGRRATRWIVVAAGAELLFFDPADPAKPARRIPIDGTAGRVRSIQIACSGVETSAGCSAPTSESALWLGAATGVYELPVEASTPTRVFVVDNHPAVRGGFNAVCTAGDGLYASHSELGLLRWCIADAADATGLFAPLTRHAKTVRGVCAWNGRLYCAIDDRIVAWRYQAVAPDAADDEFRLDRGTVSTLEPTELGLFAGTSDGRVLLWRDDETTSPEVIHSGSNRAVEALWLLATHSVRRLIFTDTTPRVHAKVLGDHYTYHFEAGGQTLRRVEVAPDWIVATNDLRDRLLCWPADAGDRPPTVIPVSQLCQASIQDVCLV